MSKGLSYNEGLILHTTAKLYVLYVTPENIRYTFRGGLLWRLVRDAVTYGLTLTPIVRASISRTLRRLEQRGLIIRHAGSGEGGYMTHIQITKAGWAKVKELKMLSKRELSVNNRNNALMLTDKQNYGTAQTTVRQPVGVAGEV